MTMRGVQKPGSYARADERGARRLSVTFKPATLSEGRSGTFERNTTKR